MSRIGGHLPGRYSLIITPSVRWKESVERNGNEWCWWLIIPHLFTVNLAGRSPANWIAHIFLFNFNLMSWKNVFTNRIMKCTWYLQEMSANWFWRMDELINCDFDQLLMRIEFKCYLKLIGWHHQITSHISANKSLHPNWYFF